MNAFLTFLEGVVSFISPCMLPMLPVYVAYFAADGASPSQTFVRALAFVCGFSAVFVALGVFAGTLGAALAAHRTAVSVVCGAMVVAFGLGYLGLFKLPFSGAKGGRKLDGILPAFVFGLVFYVGLTPCVGAFLGAALMQAASEGGAAKGALLTEFRWLTSDRLVQESEFSNGLRVVVNFSERPYRTKDGRTVLPHGYLHRKK